MVVDASLRNFLLCRAHGRRFALNLEHVEGIERSDRLDTDGADDQVVGTYDGRDGAVVVFRLSSLLGEEDTTTNGPVILTRAGKLPVGLLADHVSHARGLSRSSLFPLPEALGMDAKHTIPALLHYEDEWIPVIEPAGLFQDRTQPLPSFAQGRMDFDLPPSTSNATRLIEFSLGVAAYQHRPVTFSFSMAVGLELLEQTAYVPIPTATENFAGVIPWRGKPIALLNLAERLGLEVTNAGAQRVLVVRPNAQAAPIGLLVQAPVRILPLPIPHRPCAKPPFTNKAIRAWFDLRESTLGVLALGDVLPS